jgi:trimethylamine:corrinoid methyltransferase-like protein
MKRRVKAGKSRSSGFSLHVMTDDEVHEIHLGTLEVLKDVGVFVENEEALERFGGGGAKSTPKARSSNFPTGLSKKPLSPLPALITPADAGPKTMCS